MWTNYLKISLRNILKRKGYALLNVFGLAIGMVCALLIFQYVAYEWSYDRFHEKSSDLYRLRLDSYQQGKLAWQSATIYPAFAPTMKRDFPEVVDACRLHDAEFVATNPETNEKYTERKGYYADPAFLQMFTLPLVAGDPANCLNGPDKIILSQSTARKYFGNASPLGKHLVVKDPDLYSNFEVTGVFEDYPANSHLVLDYLVSYATLGKYIAQAWGDTTNATETSWGWYDFYTYLQLAPGTNVEAFKSKFPAFLTTYLSKDFEPLGITHHLDILPMKDIHLQSHYNQEAEINGDGQAAFFLFIIAFFILIIAWINYINLSTARAMERSHEVGVRKVLGAERRQLIGQFMMESLLLNGTALVLALVAVRTLIPAFSRFVDRPLHLDVEAQWNLWLGVFGVFVLGTLLSGLYPAFVMSGFRPLVALRGAVNRQSQGQWLRKGLIVSQFVASIALIVGTIVVGRQVSFMLSRDLGLNINQTLVLEGPRTVIDSLYEGAWEPFKTEVLRAAGVQAVTSSAYVPGDEVYWTAGARLLGHEGQDKVMNTLFTQGIDQDFVPAYQMKLAAGRNFSDTYGNEKNACLLNESAVKVLGLAKPADALNQRVRRGGDTLNVVGVLKDFHHMGLQRPIDPMIFLYRPNATGYYSIKVNTSNVESTLGSVQKAWGEHFPDDPFSFFFLDEFFNKQYQSNRRFGEVFGLFAMFAILVACLGLLGLSSYNVLQRHKEIGIRKVLGASVGSIVGLLSKDFLRLVIVAILLAIPLAWWAMRQWLQDFAFRISLEWWMFAAAGVVAVAIAFGTVSIQAMKAALENPVKALQQE